MHTYHSPIQYPSQAQQNLGTSQPPLPPGLSAPPGLSNTNGTDIGGIPPGIVVGGAAGLERGPGSGPGSLGGPMLGSQGMGQVRLPVRTCIRAPRVFEIIAKHSANHVA